MVGDQREQKRDQRRRAGGWAAANSGAAAAIGVGRLGKEAGRQLGERPVREHVWEQPQHETRYPKGPNVERTEEDA